MTELVIKKHISRISEKQRLDVPLFQAFYYILQITYVHKKLVFPTLLCYSPAESRQS